MAFGSLQQVWQVLFSGSLHAPFVRTQGAGQTHLVQSSLSWMKGQLQVAQRGGIGTHFPLQRVQPSGQGRGTGLGFGGLQLHCKDVDQMRYKRIVSAYRWHRILVHYDGSRGAATASPAIACLGQFAIVVTLIGWAGTGGWGQDGITSPPFLYGQTMSEPNFSVQMSNCTCHEGNDWLCGRVVRNIHFAGNAPAVVSVVQEVLVVGGFLLLVVKIGILTCSIGRSALCEGTERTLSYRKRSEPQRKPHQDCRDIDSHSCCYASALSRVSFFRTYNDCFALASS